MALERIDSPETWEAEEHIENCKTALRCHVEVDAKDLCPSHGPIFRALLPATIWIIRHMAMAEKRQGEAPPRLSPWMQVAKTSPIGVLGLGVLAFAYVWGKVKGVLP